MGNKRKQARRAARQALKSKPRIHGYEIDTIIVDELAVAPALPPKPKRDNSPIEARNEAQAHYLISLDTKPLTFATGEAGCGKPTWPLPSQRSVCWIRKSGRSS